MTATPSTTPTTPPAGARETLDRLERDGADVAAGLAFFDTLPPVTVDEMTGAWHGAGIDTGNPLDGMLEGMRWHGKRYESSENAHPLVMDGSKGRFSLNPARVPMDQAVRYHSLVKRPVLQKMTRPLLPLFKTRKPAARLRMVEYRGVVSGTMIYDALPINDHFRKVDEDTLMGAMDFRSLESPFLFTLHREG